MTTYPSEVWEPSSDRHTPTGALYSEAARDHLWMHFTRHSTFEDHADGGLGHSVPIITKGDGWRIWDDRGNEYIDGLAGLFVVNAGHGRLEIAEAMAKQAAELAYFPLWSYAHPRVPSGHGIDLGISPCFPWLRAELHACTCLTCRIQRSRNA